MNTPKPIIALDCDDVIVATGELLVNHYNQLHGTTVRPQDFYSKDYEHVWRAEPETATRDLFAYLLTEEYIQLAPMENAAAVLRKLAEQYTLYIVTGRPDETEQATLQWIEKYLPGIFEQVIFTNFFKLNDSKGALRTKADVCKELGAQWLVDDHLYHIHNVADQGITGLLFGDLPWEQLESPSPHIVKIKDWQGLEAYFLTAKKVIPNFKSEQEAADFWNTHDSTEYVDWSQATQVDANSGNGRQSH
jgi:5'(3')-deoxyribonucleotidase